MTIVLGGTVDAGHTDSRGLPVRSWMTRSSSRKRGMRWTGSRRDLRSAGSDPYNADRRRTRGSSSIRMVAQTTTTASGSRRTSTRGPDGDIADAGENVTIALDAANSVITRAGHELGRSRGEADDRCDLHRSQLHVSRCVADGHEPRFGSGRLHPGAGHGAVTWASIGRRRAGSPRPRSERKSACGHGNDI